MVDESSPRVSRKNGTYAAPRAGPTRKGRYTADDAGDEIKCSSKHCRACTAGLVADCVALCCCPFAVVEFLALALVKVPWMVGRRCLGLGRKKGQRLEMKRKSKRSEVDCVLERDRNARKRREMEAMAEIEYGFAEEDRMESGSARSEAERVWLELYQVGHLGFGRVSFTGITGIQISG